MESALRIRTNVLPGHRIEILAPEFQEGDPVEVILLSGTEKPRKGRSMLEIVQELSGHRSFQTPEEVDRYLDEERNSWDR